ncbi:MAG: glycosyltransferase family 2 protein [Geobacteraceae bacterium]|nr:glycosyltransferase family 2 protein [Geobacteraceae bacterium]
MKAYMTERVIIVVPIHNGGDDTLELLQSIADSETPDLEIIIVDDGSTDGSAALIATHFPSVTILTGDGGLWWAGATNLGVREALRRGADYVLTMNNDNVVGHGFLRPLLSVVRSETRSIVTSKLLSLSEPGYVCSFGGCIDWLRGEIRDRTNRRDHLDFSSPARAEWVHASSTIYPSAVFHDIGYFDSDNFPQYHGDADFSLRAARAGYSLLVEPRSVVYRRTATSGGLILLDKGGFWRNVTDIRSIFYYKANYNLYFTHCRRKPFQLFLLIRYVRLLYSLLHRRLFRSNT